MNGAENGLDIGVAQLPGFAESLRILSEGEQYALTDIAMMFGVSRERMRQLAVKHHVRGERGRGLNHLRVWDDAASVFRPVRRGLVTRSATAHRVACDRTKREEERAARRTRIVYVIQTLVRWLGRTPSLKEICGAAGYNHVPSLLYAWQEGRNTKGLLAQMWKDAGVEARGRGGHGHIAYEKSRENR